MYRQVLTFIGICCMCACGPYVSAPLESSANDRPPAEPGVCYLKCIIPDSYEEKIFVLPIYTGAYPEDFEMAECVIQEGYKTSKWVKKPAKNCKSIDPNDCLVWCLEEEFHERIAYEYLLDTLSTSDFILETFVAKQLVKRGGFTQWKAVVCENKLGPRLFSDVCQALNEFSSTEPLDCNGQLNSKLKDALSQFQKNQGLAVGGLTLESLDVLGVSY